MDNKLFASIGFSMLSLFFAVFILVMYLNKKRFKNLENTLFITLLLSIFLLVTFEITYVLLLHEGNNIKLASFFCRAWLNGIILWMTTFTYYLMILRTRVIKDEKIKMKTRKKILIYFIIVSGLALLGSNISPITLYDETYSIYSFSGDATNFGFLIAGICILTTIYCLLIRKDMTNSDQRKPVIFTMFSVAIITMIQFNFDHLDCNYQNFEFTLLLMTLFFTLENQDNKLLDEHASQIKEAERASQEKTEFLTSVSHEIRTPINTIMGFSDILIREGAADQNIVKRDTKYIHSAAESLLFLINNILDLSRIESKKETLVEKEYNMQDLMLEIFEFVNNRVDTSKVKFNLNVNPNMPKICYGDYAKTVKIITNVLFNVMNYTKEGSITLEVSGGKTEDEVFAYQMKVTSTGSYIKPDEYSKYYLNDLQFSNKVNKAVLGVNISKLYANMIGGNVTFSSNRGTNVSYLITLNTSIADPNPVGDINKLFTGELEDDQAFDLTGKKILVVDDNNVNIKLFLRMLEKYNADTSSCKSGKECIDLVEKNKYDAIFLDHMMPGMDGIETLGKLRDLYEELPPVVALTANASSGIREEYKNEGFYDYLAKPIDKGELSKLLFNIFKK